MGRLPSVGSSQKQICNKYLQIQKAFAIQQPLGLCSPFREAQLLLHSAFQLGLQFWLFLVSLFHFFFFFSSQRTVICWTTDGPILIPIQYQINLIDFSCLYQLDFSNEMHLGRQPLTQRKIQVQKVLQISVEALNLF